MITNIAVLFERLNYWVFTKVPGFDPEPVVCGQSILNKRTYEPKLLLSFASMICVTDMGMAKCPKELIGRS